MLYFAAMIVLIQPPSSPCGLDTSVYLSQDYEAFDQSNAGWRSFAEQGYYPESARLIEGYIAAHIEDLEPSEHWHLVWHSAQMYAYASNYPASLEAFEASRQINQPHNRNTQLKTDAVIAFLSRDLEALLSVRDELANMPEPDGFQQMVQSVRERFPDANPPSWPPELARVNSYIRCFESSYEVAYEGAC